MPTPATVTAWHSQLYAGCQVPSAVYVGHLRGDVSQPDLVDYEVGIGPVLADGYAERVGVWSTDVAAAVTQFFSSLHQALGALDALFAPGVRPVTVDDLNEVIALTAIVHGEWVRIHPFVNGNGRTARLWVVLIARRYELPVFVSLKPRPADVAYARAAKRSMGRPPNFVGDHTEATAVFGHLLSLLLMP